MTMQEENMMRKFLREGLGNAMSKCLDEIAVLGWPQGTQVDIMDACMNLVELAVAKLQVSDAPVWWDGFMSCGGS
jgi:hypothetical protein